MPSKGVAGITINEAPSLFSTPHCLMAKGGAKVSQDDALEEFSYDNLVDMLNDAGELVIKKKAKLKYLELKYGSLQTSYEELKTSHENLKETHEKLKEAHNTLLDHKDKAKLSMGLVVKLANLVIYLALLTPHVAQVINPLVMSHLPWRTKI